MEATSFGFLNHASGFHVLLRRSNSKDPLSQLPSHFEIPITLVDKSGHKKRDRGNVPLSEGVAECRFVCSRSNFKGRVGLGLFPTTRGSYSQSCRAAYRPGHNELPHYWTYCCPLIWPLFALEQTIILLA